MRPDIEWQVDQPDGDQHTIVHSRPAATSRRHRVIMAVMIILGIALGVAYHAIPEPTPRVAALPQVTPTPVPPPPIDDIIGRESYALAVGNLNAFLALQDPTDPNWQRAQLGAFRTWGKPANGPLYTIVESGTLPANRAWADVLQFRGGEYFRETRFYRLDGGQWRRIAPVTDVDFWGIPQTFQTDHFDVRFRTRDVALAHDVARQFESVYTRACRDLECTDRPLPPAKKLQVRLWPDTITPDILLEHDQIVYDVFSPRLAGLYYQGPTPDQPSLDRPVNQAAVNNILYFVARSSIQLASWPSDIASEQLLLIITDWEQLRFTGQPMQRLLQQPQLLAGQDLLSPAELWTWPSLSTTHNFNLIYAESTALINFVDYRYGPSFVVGLLHQLGQTGTFSETLTQLGLSYPDFDRDWQTWLKQFKSKE